MTGAVSYLLVTNVLSDLIRNPAGVVAQQIERVGEDRVYTNAIVAAELHYGELKSGSEQLAKRVDLILSSQTILPVDLPSDRESAVLRHALSSQGTPIGPNDLLIAAHARSPDLTVVTGNLPEFQRVPGLKVENCLVK